MTSEWSYKQSVKHLQPEIWPRTKTDVSPCASRSYALRLPDRTALRRAQNRSLAAFQRAVVKNLVVVSGSLEQRAWQSRQRNQAFGDEAEQRQGANNQ